MAASNQAGGRPPQRVAVIEEDQCIGCALCIKACPVDAIVGAHAFMHTVIAHECIGCELCVAPCPVDCIAMVTARVAARPWRTPRERARFARARRKRRDLRLAARAQRYAAATQARREALKTIIRRKSAPRGGRG